MALNKTILKLTQTGDLLSLFKQGFISWRLIRDRDIYLTYQTYVQTGMKKTEAVKTTAVQFNCSDVYIWETIKKMAETNTSDAV